MAFMGGGSASKQEYAGIMVALSPVIYRRGYPRARADNLPHFPRPGGPFEPLRCFTFGVSIWYLWTEERGVLRFSIRELLWLTLVVAIGTCWWTESARAKQWRRRAEIAAGQLEVESLTRMVFEPNGVRIASPSKDPQFSEVFVPTDEAE
jgi:hypothetical protein